MANKAVSKEPIAAPRLKASAFADMNLTCRKISLAKSQMQISKFRLCLLSWGVLVLGGCGESRRDLQPEEIWSRVSPSVIRVEATSLEGEVIIGSGFVCELQGKKFVLSNRHVVLGAKEVRIGTSNENLVLAPSYRISPKFDLALVDLPSNLNVPPLKTRTGEIRIGERVFAIGFPLGLNKSITQGLVSSETDNLIQFDAPISSGNSGGPLVDKNGNVLGIVAVGSTGNDKQIVQNLNFAIKTALIPKVEVFKDPIVKFYDAWRDLINIENRLLEGVDDFRIFDVETCVKCKLAIPFISATDTNFSNLDQSQKQEAVNRTKENCAEQMTRVIRRYGSLDAGVKASAAYLRNQILELDKIPDLFLGLESDDLLMRFSRERKHAFGLWDVKPSQIVPLLKTSIEFAKARYEDKAYEIEFGFEMAKKLNGGNTNFITSLRKLDDKSFGERATVRLPYDKLATDDDRIRMYFVCGQKINEGKSSLITEKSITKRMRVHGGFENEISCMFTAMAEENIQHGDIDAAFRCMMNEVSLKKYPDRVALGFLYACSGNFEKAFEQYSKAYTSSLDEVDAYSLDKSHFLMRSFLLKTTLLTDGSTNPSLPLNIRNNLNRWKHFVMSKPAFSLAEDSTLAEAIESPEFDNLSDFEKCWVLDTQEYKASVKFGASTDWLADYESTLKTKRGAFNLFQKYFLSE